VGWLYPVVTGKSFFDTSSIIHLAFWVFLGSCFAYGRISTLMAMVYMLAIAYTWEIFERFAEVKWPTIWLHPEGWLNAWVSDPLMGVLGVLVAYWLVKKQ
jgi:hypothetical protein